MDAILVDVGEILEDLGAEVSVHTETAMGLLTVGDETFRPLAPVEVDVTVTNTGSGLVARGRARLTAEAECCRCLEPFETVIEADVEGFYVQPGQEADLPDDQEYEVLSGRSIDLSNAVEAALAVEAPFAPLCGEQCAGICPVCGANRNESSCDCAATTPAGGPFDVLRGLLEPEDSPPE